MCVLALTQWWRLNTPNSSFTLMLMIFKREIGKIWPKSHKSLLFCHVLYACRDRHCKICTQTSQLTLFQTFGIFANMETHTSLRSTSLRLRKATRLALEKTPALDTLIEPAPAVCAVELCRTTPDVEIRDEESVTACVRVSEDAIRSNSKLSRVNTYWSSARWVWTSNKTWHKSDMTKLINWVFL